jgi:small multidrug resistance family-3 protein
MEGMKNVALFVAAAIAEIGGCYAFWLWLKLNRSPVWGAVGVGSLIVFAWLLTRLDLAFAGRTYAAYGGIYIAMTLLWLWRVEGARPDRWDLMGGMICLIGAGVIIFGPRNA